MVKNEECNPELVEIGGLNTSIQPKNTFQVIETETTLVLGILCFVTGRDEEKTTLKELRSATSKHFWGELKVPTKDNPDRPVV